MTWVLTFLAMLGLDIMSAWYTRAVAARHPTRAALAAMAMVLFGGAATIAYVDNHWMLVPALAGAALGTYIGTKR